MNNLEIRRAIGRADRALVKKFRALTLPAQVRFASDNRPATLLVIKGKFGLVIDAGERRRVALLALKVIS